MKTKQESIKLQSMTVSQLFEQCAETYSDKIAVQSDYGKLSYKELNLKANVLANHLRQSGVQSNTLVAVYIERSLEFIIAILAIIKAGGAYVPLDIDAPLNRNATIIHESSPYIIITTTSNKNALHQVLSSEATTNIILEINTCFQNIPLGISNPICINSSNDLIHVMYTSGSTGTPKGCMISHRGVINLVQDTNYILIQSSDHMAHIANTAFDASTFEIWGALLNGASLHIINKNNLLSFDELASTLRNNQITIILVTTSLFNLIVESKPDCFDTIRWLLFGGEQANPKILQSMLKRKEKYNLNNLTLINLYGPTECTVAATSFEVKNSNDIQNNVPIGNPIYNIKAYILDEKLNTVSNGEIGELYLGGKGLALGYLNNSNETSGKFIQCPWDNKETIYKTGDLVYSIPDLGMVFVGRVDNQIKIRGFRIELAEIESCLLKFPTINQSVVVSEYNEKTKQYNLIAYITVNKTIRVDSSKLHQFLKKNLPNYMIPSQIIQLDHIPLNNNGKIDRKILPELKRKEIFYENDKIYLNYLEREIANILTPLLSLNNINTTESFFNLGANSLILAQFCVSLNNQLSTKISIVDIFTYPTVRLLANFIDQSKKNTLHKSDASFQDKKNLREISSESHEIAIIGLSCRLPGASNVQEFWNNLINEVESIKKFSLEELQAAGENKESLEDSRYVSAKGVLNNIDQFDANFFGYSANDAKMTDPQQRLLLECAWEALESAGYSSDKYDGSIGAYTSMADSLYLQNNLLKNNKFLHSSNWFQMRIASSLTTLSTQISYRMNLKGPSINLTTACSSSLVSIITACKELVSNACDIAIAGAANICVPQERGYLYQKDGIESSDGHTRTFDAHSNGTVFSNGLGVVVLKKLKDAIKDGDYIYGVIKGWNINNDGSRKAGFSAPSVIGQTECIAAALNFSNILPESISYVEAHGTGTSIGDPIEVKALANAFNTNKKQFCALGSLKTNIGHTDIAAGMASIIKTTLALKNKILPASLHYHQPNPEINFPDTPFYVNANTKQWNLDSGPRRAGINSSGIGGTNAFLVLEEYDQNIEISPTRSYQLLQWSAKTKSALDIMTENIQKHLVTLENSTDLVNMAYTLQIGRSDFNYRRLLVCNNIQDAITKLDNKNFVTNNLKKDNANKLVFMFSGQGSQYRGMAKELYFSEIEFKEWVDHCLNLLDLHIKTEVESFLLDTTKNDSTIPDTSIIQPSLFILEYALSKLLLSWGVKPDAMIGHSLGEYVAACIANVITIEDAINLVYLRGQLMSNTAPGKMLAIQISPDEITKYLDKYQLSLAAINADTSCVVSGTTASIDALEKECNTQQLPAKKLTTMQAFHSSLMDSILEQYYKILQKITLKNPEIPFISNLTGNWITNEEAADPKYWVDHLRNTVQFASGVQTLLDEYTIFLEVGPGKTLMNFVNSLNKHQSSISTHCLSGVNDKTSPITSILSALGSLWLQGVKIDWHGFYKNEKRCRLPLPTYPFERKRYWIDPDMAQNVTSIEKSPYEQWFYQPSWIRSSFDYFNNLTNLLLSNKFCWIIFTDNFGLGENIVKILKIYNQSIVIIRPGNDFKQINENEYFINYRLKSDFKSLVQIISKINSLPLKTINLFGLTTEHNSNEFNLSEVEETIHQTFYSNLFFMQAMVENLTSPTLHHTIVTNELYSVLGNETIYPAKAAATGPCRVIPQEHREFKLRLIDLNLCDIKNDSQDNVANQIIFDTLNNSNNAKEQILAYRQNYRWTQTFQPAHIASNQAIKLKPDATYLFTGGLGGISLTLAKTIAKTNKNPYLYLISRSEFPIKEEWENWLKNHPENSLIKDKIQKLLELQKLGAEVMILKGDVTDYEQMFELIRAIKMQRGHIDGVVHAAGVPGGGLMQLKTEEIANKVLNPKIKGTYILTHLLRNDPLEFFLTCSSVSSVVGELSQIDYCSANACLDAFSSLLNNTKIKSINWNSWREVGMAVETERPKDITYFDRNNDISPEEGAKIFEDVLNNQFNQIIVSTIPINTFIDLVDSNKDVDSVYTSDENSLEDISIMNENYQPASTPTEQQLIAIWENLLGIKGIGILDEFAALGGHSLMALGLLTKLDNLFNIKISLKTLQEANTVQKLAKVIESSNKKEIDYSEIVVPIQQGHGKSILWCFHPVGGTVFNYISITKHTDQNLTVYGIQDPSIHKGNLVFSTLEEMATAYIKAIQKIQPNGPYLLSGWSFGATLAVEVAKQLSQQGHLIKPLIFFDGWAKFSQGQKIKEVFIAAMKRLSNTSVQDEKFINLSWKRMDLLLSYNVPKIKEKIILFKANELLPEYHEIDNKYNNWDYYAENEIEVHFTHGNHENMFCEPNAMNLGQALNAVLANIISKETIPNDRELIENNC